MRYLATLLGVSLAVHQLGGFYGAWLGGIAVANFGDYNWMWYADALLATTAAICNLPIREARLVRAPAAACSYPARGSMVIWMPCSGRSVFQPVGSTGCRGTRRKRKRWARTTVAICTCIRAIGAAMQVLGPTENGI